MYICSVYLQKMKVNIYVLCDPITCKVRYIGRTRNDIEIRLAQHIVKAKHSKKPNHNQLWIQKLLRIGKKPIIKKLTEIEGWPEAHDLEQSLIEKYSHRDLTNSADYGCSPFLLPTVKEKISDALKEYYKEHYNSKSKAIEVYDLEGNYVNTYSSATEFAKTLGVMARHVTRVASQTYGRRQIKGYQVKYKSDVSTVISKLEKKPKKKYTVLKRRKLVRVINVHTNDSYSFIGVNEACAFINCSRSYFQVSKRNNTLLFNTYQIIPGSV